MSKSNNPLISLIVPVYNIPKYLERCVDSIINQSYENMEIILVNDGSTDHSGQICDAYSQKDKRVRVIHKINGGLSNARNAGLDAMKGKYVGFVDGDDFIDKYMYETLVKAILDNDADIVQTGFYHTDEDGNIEDEITFKEASYDNLDDMFYARFKENNIHVGVWTKLYKSTIFKSIRFSEGHVYEDYAILPMILNECKKFVVIDGAFYNYASNPQGISNNPVSLSVIKSRLEMPLYVLKCIEKINKNYIGYAYRYICESGIKGYCKIIETDRIDEAIKKEYMGKLITQFKKYYKIYKKDSSLKKQKLSTKIKLYIFSITPYITYLIIVFKNFIRKLKKRLLQVSAVL
jgi:glycosyltransferase involved in cell wall biosynthesis